MRYNPALLTLLLVMLSACSSRKTEDQQYQQHKESLAEKEQKDPLQFLSVAGDHKKNLVGQTVVSGAITNSATLTAYKDVRIKMLCYKQNRLVEEHENVVRDEIKQQSDQHFKLRYRLPKGADSIALSVMSAVVAVQDAAKK